MTTVATWLAHPQAVVVSNVGANLAKCRQTEVYRAQVGGPATMKEEDHGKNS